MSVWSRANVLEQLCCLMPDALVSFCEGEAKKHRGVLKVSFFTRHEFNPGDVEVWCDLSGKLAAFQQAEIVWVCHGVGMLGSCGPVVSLPGLAACSDRFGLFR